ncbi:hypothetical protein ACFLFF_28720 [Brevibacillus reuszeri]|uniref:hypothetical protein n=1 Tax=Brevibacillus reuszeri TaxID=54915 RepID=UPI00366F6FF6
MSQEDFEKKVIICQDPDCKNEFTVYEGIRNGLKAEDTIVPNPFLASDMFIQPIEIKIGYSIFVELPKTIQKAYQINVHPLGDFIAGATEISPSGFRIITSVADNGPVDLFGSNSLVLVRIHAKTEDYAEPWLHLLSHAYEHYQSGDYLTSILLSEISFETYIDKTLSDAYQQIGLDSDSISRFITACEMPSKVNPLMNNLFGIKMSSFSSWSDWEKKVLKWRNNIAHGNKTSATKDEAKLAYETVVDSIFYFIEFIDKKQK